MSRVVSWTRADVEKVFPNQPEVVDRYMQTIDSINAGNANSDDAAVINALGIAALVVVSAEQDQRVDDVVVVVDGLTTALQKLIKIVMSMQTRIQNLEAPNG